jgi:hypothetical protein
MFRERELPMMVFLFWQICHIKSERASVMYQNIIIRDIADKTIFILYHASYSNDFKLALFSWAEKHMVKLLENK